jgi:hypothetical protein
MRCQARGEPGGCVILRVFCPPFPIRQHLPPKLFRLQAEPRNRDHVSLCAERSSIMRTRGQMAHTFGAKIFVAYLCESFARGFVNSHALGSAQVAGEQRDMWELMVEAARTPALQWAVIAAVVLIYIFKVLSSAEGPLMGDMYQDELDT